MQRTLDKLFAWANRWDVEFNVSKCAVMNIRRKNLEYDGWVKPIDEERDRGVFMSKDLKFSEQCLLAKRLKRLVLGDSGVI